MTIYYGKGDAIKGYKVIVSCRKHGKWKIFKKSAEHKGSKCILTDDVFCVIDIPLKSYMK